MKVLIVDDISDSVKGIKDFCDEKGWIVQIVSFENVYTNIIEFDPDVIVLDWCQDAGDEIANPILDNIWINGYRPIVIFSANAEIISIDEKRAASNLLQLYSKGDETPVYQYLEENEAYVTALADYRREMGLALVEAFNAIKPIRDTEETYPGDDIVKYVLAKRTSTFFDIQYTGQKLPPWGMYIYPSVSNDLLVCDVIRAITPETDLQTAGAPEEYMIILTPSCDMVALHPKVTHVLCARCYGKKNFYCFNIKSQKGQENEQLINIQSALNRGYNDRWVALPNMKNVIPFMTVDLKKVELVAISDIALSLSTCGDRPYVRIISIDSPFREQIVWAHMQNSCRPGVPDRDTENWAMELKRK